MVKQFLLIIGCLFSIQVMSQTGIGTTTPHASAKLEVSATNKGFLPPRVTLISNTDATTIPSPAEGLLVYNLGSVGLQAGYYYWNSANWATIATAALAGNAVVASDLIKLYGEVYSVASNKLSNASGFSFTVPVSGRYLFDFSSTTWGGNATTTFKVRQGTTDLGTDFQTSLNNNVHVEYNGKVEVNLQSGITYNVALTTNANRDAGDYDRVYYKLVAGNLPVNQHIASANIQLNNNYLSNDGGNEGIRVDNSGNVGIGTNNPTSLLNIAGGGVKLASGFGNSTNRPSLNTSSIGNYEIRGVGSISGSAQNDLADDGFLRLSAGGGTSVSSQSSIDISGFSTVADMSNNIVMRTNGTERVRIDNSGNVNITGKINLTDPSGNVITKASGFVNAGDYVTLGNLKARIPTSGNRSLQLATVSGTYSVYGSAVHVFASNLGSTTIDGSSPRAISTTPIYLNSGNTFATAGGTDTWNIMDTSNLIGWRISCIIGSGYNNNLITIERVF